jgi:hypothetical protein
LAVAIAGIENMSSLPDSLYNIVGEKDTMGITLSTYGDPISYLSQSELDSNPEAENIDTIDHEAIHQAFSAEGMTEGGDSAEEAWIQSYLEKHPLTDYLKTHHCPD